jgi:hypothetical protein
MTAVITKPFDLGALLDGVCELLQQDAADVSA